MGAPNVLPLFPMPTRNDLRVAVARIVRSVQVECDLSDYELAEAIGCSESTIRNARNKLTDLNALTIARIGAKFGENVTDPYHKLYGAQSVPAYVAATPDPMPAMMALAGKIVGPGLRNHQTMLAAKPEIEACYATISALRAHIQELAA